MEGKKMKKETIEVENEPDVASLSLMPKTLG